MTNVGIFNVKYSPNLGDGLIAVCLERAITELAADQDFKITSIDLAGRTSFSRGDAARVVTLKLLDRLPIPLRRSAVFFPSRYRLHKIWMPHYKKMCKAANLLIIGGGNLFSDADLNFPLKLNAALKFASRGQLPVAIYGVGVSEYWTPKGIDLIRKGLDVANVKYAAVRDQLSKAHFDHFFSEAAGTKADVVYDPALLISSFRPKVLSQVPRPVIGLNITSAIAVRYHSKLTPTDDGMANWYIKLSQKLSEAGYSIVTFTNGSPEDESFLKRLEPRLTAIPGLEICRVSNPFELSDLISRFSLLVAHRMHAIISAYSYAIPFIPLTWDTKIGSFLEMLGLEATSYEAVTINIDEIVNLVAARSDLKDKLFKNRESVIDGCYRDVAKVAKALLIC